LLKELNSKTILLIILVLIFFCSIIINIAAAEQNEKIEKNVFIELFLNADYSHCPKAAFCLEELAWIIESLDDNSRLGVCLDTCHLFAGGYELRGRVSYERLVRSVERLFGIGRVGCWHLNDSKKDMGSHLDRHQHIGEGQIGVEFFSCIVSDPRWGDTPCLLETPKEGSGDEGNLALLRKLRGF